jgi:hypothetical protein
MPDDEPDDEPDGSSTTAIPGLISIILRLVCACLLFSLPSRAPYSAVRSAHTCDVHMYAPYGVLDNKIASQQITQPQTPPHISRWAGSVGHHPPLGKEQGCYNYVSEKSLTWV